MVSSAFRLFATVVASFAVWSAAQASDALQRIQQQRVLKWGADAEGGAPYVFPNPPQPSPPMGEREKSERFMDRAELARSDGGWR